MDNKIIIGRSGSGKTTYITEQIKADLKQGYDNIFVIVPDQFTFETERELIKQTGKGLFEIRVLSFRRLISALRDELGTTGDATMDEVGKTMFVNKLLYDYDNELDIYSGSYKAPAFSTDMAKQITELKQFGVEPDALDKLNIGGRTGAKLGEISTVYKAYTTFKDTLKDNEDIINTINERIPKSRLLKGARVYIDHFDVFTFQGFNTIEQLSAICDRVWVCLTGDRSKQGLFSITTQTIDKLTERLPNAEVVMLERQTPPTSITFLEERLFDRKDDESTFDTADGKVELFSFSNALSEIDHAVAKIIELKEQGYNFYDIALMVGDMEEYANAVNQCFADCGIPCFLDEKTYLMSGRLGRFVIYALRFALSQDKQDLISLLKQEVVIEERKAVRAYENYLLAFGMNAFKKPIAKNDHIEALRKQIHSRYLSPKYLSEDQNGGLTITPKAFMSYIGGLDIHLKDDFEERSYKKLLEALESLITIFGEDTPIDLKLFTDILETGLNGVTIGSVPEKYDSVLVGDISRTKLQKAKCLLVLGASDGVIPKVTEKSGLLSDYDVSMLPDDIKVGRDTLDLNRLETLLTYKMLTMPTDYLYISHSDRGVYGDKREISPLFKKITRLIPSTEVMFDVPFNEDINMRLLKSKSLALKALFTNIHSAKDSFITRGTYRFFLDNGLDKSFFTPKSYDLSIPKKQVETVYQNKSFSASRIETYFKCAFKHFIRYGIKPKQRELLKINQLNTGSLLHSIIEEFSGYIIDETTKYRRQGESPERLYDALRSKVETGNLVETIVADRLKSDGFAMFSKDNTVGFMRERIEFISKNALINIIDELKANNYTMAYSEQTLKEFGDYTLDGTDIVGRIDRIDISDEGVRIIDYKAGGSSLKFSEIYGGIKLQLLIYMDATVKHLQKKFSAALPMEMDYMQIFPKYDSSKNLASFEKALPKNDITSLAVKEGTRKATDINEEQMSKLIAFGVRKAEKAIREINGGNISINPYFIDHNNEACKYCEYMDICKNDCLANRRELKNVKLEDIVDE